MDAPVGAEYLIVGNLTVNKNQEIRLPNWNKISEPEYQTLETGLSKTSATLDCKIKNVATNEIIGEFRVAGDAMKKRRGRYSRARLQQRGGIRDSSTVGSLTA